MTDRLGQSIIAAARGQRQIAFTRFGEDLKNSSRVIIEAADQIVINFVMETDHLQIFQDFFEVVFAGGT